MNAPPATPPSAEPSEPLPVRSHWIVYARGTGLAVAGAMLIPIGIWLGLDRNQIMCVLTLLAGLASVAAGGADALRARLHHHAFTVLLLPGAIVQRSRGVSFAEEILNTIAVRKVRVDQSPLGAMLGFGDVTVSIGDEVLEWKNVIDPRRLAGAIMTGRAAPL